MSEILKKDYIKLGVEADSKEDCIKQMIEVVNQAGLVNNRDNLFEAIMQRELEFTTKIMDKIAIPHAKCDEITKASVVFGRSNYGITWSSGDIDKVHLVFLIMVPSAQAGNDHLKILSILARCLSHDDFREKLLTAETVDEVDKIIGKQMIICAGN